MLEPVVLALSSDEPYFPGLYCAVASALSAMDPAREVDVKVLDGGLSKASRDTLTRFIERTGKRAQLDFIKADPSIFDKATLGPGRSHMAYCRILAAAVARCSTFDLPRLRRVGIPRSYRSFLIFIVSRKTHCSSSGLRNIVSRRGLPVVAKAMKLPAEGGYFNSGVMLMNLDELRKQDFFERAVEFLSSWSAALSILGSVGDQFSSPRTDRHVT